MRADRELRATTALFGLGAVVVILPLARGAVDWPTQAAGTAFLLVAWWLAAGRGTVAPATLALLAVAGWIGFQLVPLPPAAHALSPVTRQLFRLTLQPLDSYPAWRALSLDPPETGRALLHAIATSSAFACATHFADTHRRKTTLATAIAAAGAAVATVALGAAALGLAPLLAGNLPFVNPNHLSSLCALSALVALGLALRNSGGRRVALFLAFAVCGVVVALSLSRAGILALIAGCGLFAMLLLTADRGGRPPAARRAGLLVAGAGTVAAATAYLALEPVLAELATLRAAAQDTKFQLWPVGLRMARDFPVFGVGRGAFATVFPGYKTDALPLTFTHLENSWLQPVVDLGWPLGLLLVGTFAWIWLRAARRPDRSTLDAALLAATAAVGVHDVADFSLEVLGVAVPFAVAMGLLLRSGRAIRLPRVVFAGVGGVLACAAMYGLALNRAHPTERDALAVGAALDAQSADAAARASARWHPADYLPHAAAGARWVGEQHCGAGLPWLLRAMALNPTAPQPHALAGRCLAATGKPALARQELKLAILYGDPTALPTALDLFPALGDLLDVVPDTPDGLFSLGALLAAPRKADAAVVYRRLLDEYADRRAEIPLARMLLDSDDVEGGLEVSRRHIASQPDDPQGYCLTAEALTRLGRTEEAGAELERGLTAAPGAPPIAIALSDRAFAARRFGESRRWAEAMVSRTPSEIALRESLVARALAAQGRYGEAIDRARAASAARPDSPGPLENLAELCRTAHRYGDAIAALEAARALSPDRPGAYDDRITALRAEQAAQQEGRTRQLLLEDQLPATP